MDEIPTGDHSKQELRSVFLPKCLLCCTIWFSHLSLDKILQFDQSYWPVILILCLGMKLQRSPHVKPIGLYYTFMWCCEILHLATHQRLGIKNNPLTWNTYTQTLQIWDKHCTCMWFHILLSAFYREREQSVLSSQEESEIKWKQRASQNEEKTLLR